MPDTTPDKRPEDAADKPAAATDESAARGPRVDEEVVLPPDAV